ncbi:hypothetical protein TNCV_824991 [Trichonephila clavipes]|nr:hypothetical protein TNCV_824991 [Trichonephila clavipes]
MSPHHNSIEYVCDGLGKAISQRRFSPRILQELKALRLEKWALLPQILTYTLIFEACIGVHSGYTPDYIFLFQITGMERSPAG